jgi:uncharacterized protein (TIGR03437 family)
MPIISSDVTTHFIRYWKLLMRQHKFLFQAAALAVFGLAVASGQTQDTSGNGLLSGTYQFRHVAVLNVDENLDPIEIAATYGTIRFSGGGNYTITGTTVDNTVSSGAPQPLNVSGTYAIGGNGAGYIANPLAPTDFNSYIYGAEAQGVFTGSSTESEQGGELVNDIFIAIPIASTAPTNASFTSAYQTGLLDFTGAGSTATKNALFELTPNGQGKFGVINLSGQAANQSSSSVTQSVSGATYNFNGDGSATLTIPLPSPITAANALFTGSKTIFPSKDGNFILGWTAGGYDIFFGVKALAIPGTNSVSGGLYFTAALEDSPGAVGTDSYYGGLSIFGDSAGDALLHERVNTPQGLSYDFGTDDQINLNADGTTPIDFNGYQYIFGDAGNCQNGTSTFPCAAAFVAIGSFGNFSLLVGLHVPIFSGSGVYIYPTGVVNSASYQPITASLAPGELITIFGSGLASGTVVTQGGQPYPTTLGGVTVSIDNIPCPISYVSPNQLSVIVPYEVASNQTGLANIQVTNGAQSNVVQMYLTDASPGSYSLETTPALVTQAGQTSLDGIGYSAAEHATGPLAGQFVTPTNPAQPGEYISVYLTGLGTVTPTITDGALGPSSTLSWADLYNAGNMAVLFNDFYNGSTENFATIEFAGLAPGYAGLYQINVQVPTSGLGDGDDVYIEFVTDTADVDQIQIPYGSASSAASLTAKVLPEFKASRIKASLAHAARVRAMRSQGAKPMTRRVKRGAPPPADPLR